MKKSAASYNIEKKRDYNKQKQVAPKRIPPPRGKTLLTKAKLPVVIGVDVTGSMSKWPRIIFEKLCILYNEARFFLPEALRDSFEISFVAIGDAFADSYPLQVTDFAKGVELDTNIAALYPEGGGGGGYTESYELAAYYYASRCKMLEAVSHPRPMFIFIGDEAFYGRVNRNHIDTLMGDPPATDLFTDEVFEELKKLFDVYILRIQYGNSDAEPKIHKQWEKVLGKSRVILMHEPQRVVDTILGLIAANVENFDKFKARIEVRQTPEQVDQVYSALHGLKMPDKTYVYKFQVLRCPECNGNLKTAPEHDSPEKCPYCGALLVRI